jgi:hypothetical protein
VNTTLRPLYSREGAPVSIIQVVWWGGGQSRSERVREISPSSGFKLRTTSQTVTSRSFDCGVLVHDMVFKVIDVKIS